MSRMDQRNNSAKTDAQREAQAKWAARQTLKRETVTKNQEARSKRSPKEQLALLDERLGAGVGAAKERARLQKQIDGAS